MFKAFIVRPFRPKNGIDFAAVQTTLIEPALAACDIQGGTTEPFLQAGNIRADMFQQLLVADIVVADISIHNANVFYELGIRHALQPRRTFLLRAKNKKDAKDRGPEDEVPFDLRTDRYLEYDADRPADALETLKNALLQTLASERADSPVFQMLPDLVEQERSRFLPVPQTFSDEVELAFKAKQRGRLGLLAMEAREFYWSSEGLRMVGRAQFDLGAFREARQTWEGLRKLDPLEIEANLRLGTIYQRLRELDASDLALERVLSHKRTRAQDRAEAHSLRGRNIKARWSSSWLGLPVDQAASMALGSPELLKAYEEYKQGFQEALDSFYPGLNALSLLTIAIELAQKLPDTWEIPFDTKEQADGELARLEAERRQLAGAVGLSLDSAKRRLEQSDRADRWLDISLADYSFLIGNKPKKLAFEYASALSGAADFYFDAARAQLELFQSLGLRTESVTAALGVFKTQAVVAMPVPPARVILFTGHMIDPPDAKTPRFPNSLRDPARSAIVGRLQQEIARTAGPVVALASAANGGDLLFHDACEELGVEHRLCLPLLPDLFRNQSVSPGGRFWEDRFDALLKKLPTFSYLAASPELPLWLSVRSDYTSWQRANLWLIHEALATGAAQFTLLSLWDGVETSGVGGTFHMRRVAEQSKAALVTIDLASLTTAGA